jgi:hypothetical protein
MVKCPECGMEIEHLIYEETTINEYCFTIDNEGFGEYDPQWETTHPTDFHYRCPACNTVLFFNEVKATDLLTETGGKKCTK